MASAGSRFVTSLYGNLWHRSIVTCGYRWNSDLWYWRFRRFVSCARRLVFLHLMWVLSPINIGWMRKEKRLFFRWELCRAQKRQKVWGTLLGHRKGAERARVRSVATLLSGQLRQAGSLDHFFLVLLWGISSCSFHYTLCVCKAYAFWLLCNLCLKIVEVADLLVVVDVPQLRGNHVNRCVCYFCFRCWFGLYYFHCHRRSVSIDSHLWGRLNLFICFRFTPNIWY